MLARPQARSLWFASYLQTYLERDVRAITNVRDLVTFRRSLSLLASRHGQVLNKTDLAAPLGVSIGWALLRSYPLSTIFRHTRIIIRVWSSASLT